LINLTTLPGLAPGANLTTMPQTKNIDLPTVANFDATLKAAGFKPSDIKAHYWFPESWENKQMYAVANMAGIAPYALAYPISRATAMQCLCLYVENFAE
jgi:hypothetical protein